MTQSAIVSRPLILLATAVVLVASSGATCSKRLRSPFELSGPAAPRVIDEAATAGQIVAAVNQNTAKVRSYATNNASIRVLNMPLAPALQGNIAMERPRRFRMRAGTALSGSEIDLGSNSDLYWLWAKRNDPPGVYFARHDQHAGSAAAQVMPIEPTWLIDALGLASLDPAAAYIGPTPRADGSLELRSTTVGPTGPVERVTVVDPAYAWVKEQHVYDSTGTLLASAVADEFRYDPIGQVSLPRRVRIEVPRADLSLSIDTGTPVVNGPLGDPGQLWSIPQIAGTPQIDLGRSSRLPGGPAPTVAGQHVMAASYLPQPPNQPIAPSVPPSTPGFVPPVAAPHPALQPQAPAVDPLPGTTSMINPMAPTTVSPMPRRLPPGGVSISQ